MSLRRDHRLENFPHSNSGDVAGLSPLPRHAQRIIVPSISCGLGRRPLGRQAKAANRRGVMIAARTRPRMIKPALRESLSYRRPLRRQRARLAPHLVAWPERFLAQAGKTPVRPLPVRLSPANTPPPTTAHADDRVGGRTGRLDLSTCPLAESCRPSRRRRARSRTGQSRDGMLVPSAKRCRRAPRVDRINWSNRFGQSIRLGNWLCRSGRTRA